MEIEHSVVLDVLREHTGRDNAIHRAELLTKVNYTLVSMDMDRITDRKLRDIKAELNLEYKQAICSHHKYGYWIAMTWDDVRLVRDFLASYIRELSKEAKMIKLNFLENNNKEKQLSLLGIER